MKDTEYTFAVARIRSNEYKLMNSAETEAVITSPSFNEAVAKLNEKGYGIEGDDYSPALNARLDEAWQLVYEVLPDKHGLDSVIIKNDFANLKTILKALVTDMQPDELFETPSVYDPALIKKLVGEKKNNMLPEALQHAHRSAYNILTKTEFAQLGDAVVDRAALEWSIKLSENADSDIIRKLAQLQAATCDIKVLYRCINADKSESFMTRSVAECDAFDKRDLIKAALRGMDAFMEYLSHTDYRGAAAALKTSTGAFEKWCDDERMKLLKGAKTETFGIGPVIAYYFATEAEIRNMRIILSAKKNNLPEETIRQRVRELYV